jgi:hypothetical protein
VDAAVDPPFQVIELALFFRTQPEFDRLSSDRRQRANCASAARRFAEALTALGRV